MNEMETKTAAAKNIDEYIAGFPPEVQAVLEKVRGTIRTAAPEAEETISYGIPTYKLNGRYVIYFAGYKKHISVYPAPIGVEEFKEELAAYASGQGTAKFPLNKPIPFDLITRMVQFQLKENLAKTAAKREKE
jgi:uncharacterized protein YdhG (YjbR/CyaY superfamily)